MSTVSHELRTPLNAILGWASMLRMGSVDAGVVPQAVEAIHRNASRQAKLVDDLLDFATDCRRKDRARSRADRCPGVPSRHRGIGHSAGGEQPDRDPGVADSRRHARRRRATARAGIREPPRQLAEVHAGRAVTSACRRGRPAGTSRCAWPTMASASRRNFCRTSSIGSAKATARARAITPGLGLGLVDRQAARRCAQRLDSRGERRQRPGHGLHRDAADQRARGRSRSRRRRANKPAPSRGSTASECSSWTMRKIRAS